MAIEENGGVDLGISIGSSSVILKSDDVDSSIAGEQDQSKQDQAQIRMVEHNQKNNLVILRPHNQSLYAIVQQFEDKPDVDSNVLIVGSHGSMINSVPHISSQNLHHGELSPEGVQGTSEDGDGLENDDAVESYNREMRDLEELFSKLNPLAKEFIPSSISNCSSYSSFFTNDSILLDGVKNGEVRRKKSMYGVGKRKMNSRTSMAQRDEIIRRTVYVSDIDHQVTEEQLAALFISCGQVVDCRVCGDPNSVLRFAFVEFTDEEGARASLNLSGTMLGYYPVRVLPSKTAIAPVNPTYLPRNEDEREMCARTIYCTNIDKKVTQADVKLFFESVCGKVNRLRLLGDYHHSTRISFVEFVMAESAIAALNCSGVVLGALPIRVSPSKTPVRPRVSRLPVH